MIGFVYFCAAKNTFRRNKRWTHLVIGAADDEKLFEDASRDIYKKLNEEKELAAQEQIFEALEHLSNGALWRVIRGCLDKLKTVESTVLGTTIKKLPKKMNDPDAGLEISIDALHLFAKQRLRRLLEGIKVDKSRDPSESLKKLEINVDKNDDAAIESTDEYFSTLSDSDLDLSIFTFLELALFYMQKIDAEELDGS